MRAALAILAVALLLTGCVPTREIPTTEPTEEEYLLWLDGNADSAWNVLGLDDDLRPPKPEYVYTAPADWPATIVRCMNARGYENYVSDDFSVSPGSGLASEQEQIDFFDCQTTYQVDPRLYGIFGGEMLEYLYDYNRSVLVPCLEAHGVEVEIVPPREEAAVVGGDYQGWNPYYWMYDRFDPVNDARDRYIYESCPPYPKHEALDNMRQIW
jgi:hypothetical protein